MEGAGFTSPDAFAPRSPASFANWRRRSLATRASDNRRQPTNRRIPRHEAQERLDGGGCENAVSGYLRCATNWEFAPSMITSVFTRTNLKGGSFLRFKDRRLCCFRRIWPLVGAKCPRRRVTW